MADENWLLSTRVIRQLRKDHEILHSEIRQMRRRHWRRYAGGGSGTLRVGRAVTPLTARSGDTPGSGNVQPKKIEGGNYVDDGDEITINNPFQAVVPGESVPGAADGTWVEIEQDAAGEWELIAADCEPSAFTTTSTTAPYTADDGDDLIIVTP